MTDGITARARGRDTTRPLALVAAARGVFDLALQGMVWTRRSLLMAILLGLPAAVSILYRVVPTAWVPSRLSGPDLYALIAVFYYVRNFLPLAALFYATALIADEVEGKTLPYLLTRPIPRSAILLGKFAAYLTTTLTLTLPATVVTFFLLLTARGFAGLGASVPDLFRDMGVMILALLAYGALFTLLGVLLRRPVIPGLLFLFAWELIANLPGYLPRFTITVWLRSLMTHRPAEEGLAGLFGQTLPAGLCLGVLAALIAGFLGLSLWIFSTREYVLEQ
ncbi:MAG TPA: ABC transporter permease [Vicinamibacteria bacterium]|jgi:ABC-2 type transport system permease protein|nr:ABC transporter permease [Vicinamibacteria bacterium]